MELFIYTYVYGFIFAAALLVNEERYCKHILDIPRKVTP